jgi:hypothetical protein
MPLLRNECKEFHFLLMPASKDRQSFLCIGTHLCGSVNAEALIAHQHAIAGGRCQQ